MVLPDSHRVPRAPWYLGYRPGGYIFSPTGLSPPVVVLSSTLRLKYTFVTPWTVCNLSRPVPQPPANNGCSLLHLLGLGSSPFARRYLGNHCCFLFLGVLRCFSSPGAPPYPMCSGMDAWVLTQAGSPIRVSPDQRLFAATRGFSQLTTPFVGPKRQGIHRVPLVA